MTTETAPGARFTEYRRDPYIRLEHARTSHHSGSHSTPPSISFDAEGLHLSASEEETRCFHLTSYYRALSVAVSGTKSLLRVTIGMHDSPTSSGATVECYGPGGWHDVMDAPAVEWFYDVPDGTEDSVLAALQDRAHALAAEAADYLIC